MDGMKSLMPHASLLLAGLWLVGPVSAQAHRHWDAVLLNDTGLYFFDPHSVSTSGAVRTFQSLVDYKTPQESADGKKYLSTLTEVQLHCKNNTARIMHLTYHADHMGAGKAVHKEGMIRDWLDIPAASPIERIAKRVC